MNEQNEFIKNYLHTEYVGCLKTDHEKCIDLQYEEIGNFVQNAGMFGDLEISIKHNGLVLFDTNGIYINNGIAIFHSLRLSLISLGNLIHFPLLYSIFEFSSILKD